MDIATYLYIILAAIVALAIAAFQYFYKSKSRPRITILLVFLRFFALFFLLLLLINPSIEHQVLEIAKPKLNITIDNSSSIEHLKKSNDVLNLITSIKENKKLNEKFDINYIAFAEDINAIDSLKFIENKTNILNTLKSLDNLYNENATTLLVTDGNQTIGSEYSFYRSKSKIFPIVIGDTIKQEDLKISNLNVNKYTFLGNNFPVEVFVNYNGNNSINTVLSVFEGKKSIFRKNIQLDASSNSKKIIFNLTASNIGIVNYKISLSPLNTEVNRINNHKNFAIQVVNEQSKIALISDIVHPDMGMIKRAVESNKQRKVTFLKPNDTFVFEDYQLLILYQPTVNFSNLFEKIKDDNINTFIITGTQTDWNFLNTAQSNFTKTVIQQTEDYFGRFNPNFNAFVVNDLGFSNLPPIQAYFGEVQFNVPFETLLFQNIGAFETENPLLVTFENNNKRGAALFGENSWKWRAMNFIKSKSFTEFDNFINKLIQYLSSKKLFNRLELDYVPIVYQNDKIKILATYYDNNYTIDTRADLTLTLRNKNTNELKQFPLRHNNNSSIINISDLKSGEYTFTVQVKNQNISRSGNFIILDYNIEQQFTYANIEDLKSIAKNSGGQLYHINNYQAILNSLETDVSYMSIQKTSKKTMSLINWKWLLGFIIILFSFEWFIRKYIGKI